ncbi:HIT-like domain-containing protein [Lobosporangium transversale]|uniref:Bis(5'-adenosyl)-triphosphatase n=1 Tax=Lobosporangium transversale TaxID=64571 RepID=A0A1Y2GMN0_9FUNG|nr:HIT-like domain-containing protein [Lobosporangium transversale]ORZ15537.1 HIT-like domain-containing protein [Lobosporangium transversale]|eukprot:XP_021881285.1 HIT-like domain-containing protein [Lobosporangium transversale]
MANTYRFGPHIIPASQIFFRSKYSLGLVNLKPILPGHVLVISRRSVPRFLDLNADEVSDMFQSAQRIGKVIEKEYNSTSLTIACQDGPHAGQSVPHVHVHIIPRRLGDFGNNDDIYDEIARNTKEYLTKDSDSVDIVGIGAALAAPPEKKGVDFDERKPRSEQDMAQEATRLAELLDQHQLS